MKKILFITDINSPWGGSEELWSKAANLLKKEGFVVSASVPYFKQKHDKINALGMNNINILYRKSKIRTIIRKLAKYLNLYFLYKIKTSQEKHILKTRPDLIVFSQSHVFGSNAEMKYANKKNIPYCSVTQLNSELSWPNDKNYKELRFVFNKSKKNFFVSQGNLDMLELQLAQEIKNAEVISNPYNFEDLIEIDWANNETLNFAFVGRLDFIHKGIDILLNSFSEEQWQNRKYNLNIYGKGDVELTKELSKFLNIKNITFKGHVNNISDIWKENHVLVLPSRHEGMPLVIIEAMLFKRPVITTDIAGHSELVVDGKTGYLAKAPHYNVFSEKLEELWQNKEKLEKLGLNAYEKVRQLSVDKPEVVFKNKIKELL